MTTISPIGFRLLPQSPSGSEIYLDKKHPETNLTKGKITLRGERPFFVNTRLDFVQLNGVNSQGSFYLKNGDKLNLRDGNTYTVQEVRSQMQELVAA